MDAAEDSSPVREASTVRSDSSRCSCASRCGAALHFRRTDGKRACPQQFADAIERQTNGEHERLANAAALRGHRFQHRRSRRDAP